MNLVEILCILIIHWLADFMFQTHEQSLKKSKDFAFLIEHTATYTIVWALCILFIDVFIHESNNNFKVSDVQMFLIITFILHTITDFITSRINAWLWKKEMYMPFFRSIGFDQLLHYFQLFLTCWYLTN